MERMIEISKDDYDALVMDRVRALDGHTVINMNNVCDVFIVNGGAVRALMTTEDSYEIAEYDDKEMAKAAIESVLRKDQYPDGFFDMPTAEQMRRIRDANRHLYDISISKEAE